MRVFKRADLREVSEVAGDGQVELLALVVGNHPGEYRVLVQVVHGPTCAKIGKLNFHV